MGFVLILFSYSVFFALLRNELLQLSAVLFFCGFLKAAFFIVVVVGFVVVVVARP